jgi:hypothetical protein
MGRTSPEGDDVAELDTLLKCRIFLSVHLGLYISRIEADAGARSGRERRAFRVSAKPNSTSKPTSSLQLRTFTIFNTPQRHSTYVANIIYMHRTTLMLCFQLLEAKNDLASPLSPPASHLLRTSACLHDKKLYHRMRSKVSSKYNKYQVRSVIAAIQSDGVDQ